MPRVCKFTGARTTTGRKIHYRGRPKYQGGIGLKPSGIAPVSYTHLTLPTKA